MPLENRVCDNCGGNIQGYPNRFKNKKNIFCSIECHKIYRIKNAKVEIRRQPLSNVFIQVSCLICNADFTLMREKTYKKKFFICSKKCREKYNYEKTFVTKPCSNCGNPLKRRKIRDKNTRFCNFNCKKEYKLKYYSIKVNCFQCNKEINRNIKKVEKRKPKYFFCSKSCSLTYRKKKNLIPKGKNGVSRVEIYIQKRLLEIYPDIIFEFNKNTAIGSELDIYIDSFKLGVELNGVFHYEAIHGEESLKSVQNNDKRKFQACLGKNIELVIIDISKLKYLKPERITPYLTIISNIIDSKIKESKKY